MDMDKKMRIIITLMLIFLVLFTLGCDTELGYREDHDHDGDGIQDHTAEEHNDPMHEPSEVEEQEHS